MSLLTQTTADLASLFECPVCTDYVLPPIFQCHAGHMVCSVCRPKLTCCPICRGELGSIRNLAMEKVANIVRFPCKYSFLGCLIKLFQADKLEHEDDCDFHPYKCPCPGISCNWQGLCKQVVSHLIMHHKSIINVEGEDITFLATGIYLPFAMNFAMVQSCFGHHFLLVLRKQEQTDGLKFFALVQFIGPRKKAKKFSYRLELKSPCPYPSVTWEATPQSIHQGVDAAILHSDCLGFEASIANLFATNGNLGINVTISMNN